VEILEFPKYGSIGWANYILSEGIKILRDTRRMRSARALEVLCNIEMLKMEGFWWQADRLRNWLHFYWDDLRPEGSTPREEGGLSK
jgi:hypothetical protein